jgi:hypothetical protein
MGNPGPKEGVVNSVDDVKPYDNVIKRSRLIKITATGVLSVAKWSNPSLPRKK